MNNLEYQKEIVRSMNLLASEPKVLFLGQNLLNAGCPMFNSLLSTPGNRIIEMPIIEDTQMGISIGLSLEGCIPVSCYPRIDFMMCAINQLVNHLDKVESMSRGEFKPGIIIRTQIGNKKPLNPGEQHSGDYTTGLKKILKNILVLKLNDSEQVKQGYCTALKRARQGKSTLLIERGSGVWKV